MLKPKNFLTGLGSLIMGGNQDGGNMSPGEVLQNPASLTNFLGTMVQSVSKSAKEEGKKGIVKGLISGAVSGLGGLLSGSGNNSLPQGENPQFKDKIMNIINHQYLITHQWKII